MGKKITLYSIIILLAVLFYCKTGYLLTSVPTVSAQDDKETVADEAGVEDNKSKTKPLSYKVLNALKKKKEELKRYEDSLKKKEDELNMLKAELEDRIAKFESIRVVLEELIKTKKDIDEKTIKHLVKVYETMKPNRAAPLIETLDRGLAIMILTKMKGKSAGKILSLVDPAIAAKISEQIAKRHK